MSIDFNRMAKRKRARALADFGLAIASGPLRSRARPGQRLIFTVTNGRSGSDMLHTLFSAFGNISSHHEPEPDFRHLRTIVARHPAVGRAWLRSVKLPAIAAAGGDVYVETSHMFCKGYLEPLHALGYRFDLVFLSRAPREIAMSMVKLPAIPGSGPWAAGFYVSPEESMFLPSVTWRGLSPYQLCYWHALENEARQRHYKSFAAREGLRWAEIRTGELGNLAAVLRLFADLDLDMATLDRGTLESLVGRKVNQKINRKRVVSLDPARLDSEERALEMMLGITREPSSGTGLAPGVA